MDGVIDNKQMDDAKVGHFKAFGDIEYDNSSDLLPMH